MSRPPPPPNFPTANVPRSSAYPYPPPQGSVYPPQTYNHGIYPPQQLATYATPQPHQLESPPAQRTRDPYSANTHAPASAYSYSSSPPHPSAQLPSSGSPQAPSSMAMPSAPRGYGTSTNFSRAPPPPMMQRVATMPTPGQAHNPHSVPYHNVPAPVIAHQPSHSGMSGATRSVTGDWSHYEQSYSHNENLEQRLETAGNTGDHGREKGPPTRPGAGRPDAPCRHCGRMTPRTTYDSLGGFCKEKHMKEWYAKHSQNQNQHRR